MMMGYLLLALCMALWVPDMAVGNKEAWGITEYPNPMTQPKRCGHPTEKPKSYLCDPDNLILSTVNADQLGKLLEDLTNNTSCPCVIPAQCQGDRRGFRMGIALMKKMDMKDVPTYVNNDMTDENKQYMGLKRSINHAQKFAYHLLTQWNMGRCGDDLVLIYSEQDNVLFTFTGEQTQNHISPSTIAEITLSEKARIGPGKETFVGLRSIVTNYKLALQGKYRRSTSGQASPEAAALRERRSGNSGVEVTAAVIVTSIASVMASLALHW